MNIRWIEQWHDTKLGLLIFGLVELLIAYVIGARALDTGSLIEYSITLVFLFGGLRNISKLLSNIIHDTKSKATKA